MSGQTIELASAKLFAQDSLDENATDGSDAQDTVDSVVPEQHETTPVRGGSLPGTIFLAIAAATITFAAVFSVPYGDDGVDAAVSHDTANTQSVMVTKDDLTPASADPLDAAFGDGDAADAGERTDAEVRKTYDEIQRLEAARR